MHERNATETREMAESDRHKSGDEKAMPYLIVMALLIVLVVVYLLVTR